MDGNVVNSPAADFRGLIPKFYIAPLYNERKSKGYWQEIPDLNTGEIKRFWHKGEGRDVWEDAEFIEIRITGNVSEVRNREVRESDKQTWPREYEAFKKGREQPVSGTPIDRLPFFTPSMVQEYRSVGVRTAEDIIAISDSDAQKFMGINRLKQQTKDFLEAVAGHAPAEQIRQELAARDTELAELKKQVAELMARKAK